MPKFVFTVTILASLACSMRVEAQPRRTYWGVDAGFTPKWRVPEWQKPTFDAQSVDLAGNEFRIGIVRGRILAGDWGISFVRRGIRNAGAAVFENSGDVIATTGNSLRGVEIHRFAPFGTIKDRVQIGASFGAGAGWYQGTIQVRPPGGSVETVAAKQLFSPGDIDFPVMPMARLELAVAAIVTQNLKLRVGGGVNFPGQQTFSISAVYLFAPR